MLKSICCIKWNFISSIFLIGISFILFSTNIAAESFTIKIKNTLNTHRYDEIVEFELESLSQNFTDFNFNYFSISEMGKEVLFEVIRNKNSQKKIVLMLLDFLPDETKEIMFTESIQSEKIEKKTRAYLGKKRHYELKDGFYTGGRFEEVTAETVPFDHFAHDALYQFEGPGWESERVGYRLYLDDRNRIDIFGKKKPDLIIDSIGKNDLVSDGKESYQSMQDWGQDIFKVGNSLGIGSVASYTDSVVTVSNSDSIVCKIFDNNLVSGVKTTHYGWNIGNNKFRIESYYSISAGGRMTYAQIKLDKEIDNLCTGLAKHKDTEFFNSNENEHWNYIALWGRQTTSNDNLGIAVFYNSSNLSKLTEDEINYIVVLKPDKNKLDYYFAAAWEQEKDGFKNKEMFKDYLDKELLRLNNPLEIIFN